MELDDYSQKILNYIQGLLPGARIVVSKIATKPDQFVNTVKKLLDNDYLNSADIYFRNAYSEDGSPIGNHNYEILCKAKITFSSLKITTKDGIKDNVDRESGSES